MSKIVSLMFALVFAFGFLAVSQSQVSANDAAPIYPVADAYTSQSSPNSAHGTGTRLWVEDADVNNGDMHTYITFNLAQVGSVNGHTLCDTSSAGAVLYLDVDDTSNGDHELYLAASTSWTESGLKWSNEPGATGSALSVSESTSEDSINDVTMFFIPGSVIDNAGCNSLISFVIVGGTDNAVAWQSREAIVKPQLVVDIGD